MLRENGFNMVEGRVSPMLPSLGSTTMDQVFLEETAQASKQKHLHELPTSEITQTLIVLDSTLETKRIYLIRWPFEDIDGQHRSL